MGKSLADFAPARDRKLIEEKTSINDDGGVEFFEFTAIRKDKTKIFLQAASEQIRIAGKPGVLCSLRDRSAEITGDEHRKRRSRDLDIAEKIMTAVHQSREVPEIARAVS